MARLARIRRRPAKRAKYGAVPTRRDAGVALILTLLLLVLMAALGFVMALTVNSDMLINGYYSNYRGAFYAADSGLNIARAQLASLTQTAVNLSPCTGWTNNAAPCDQPPLAATTGATVLSNIISQYGSFTALNTGQAGASWPESFKIADGSGCTNSFASAGQPTPTAVNSQTGQITAYRYVFNYTICSVGRAGAVQQALAMETGSIIANIQAQTASTQGTAASFAAFGAFVHNFPPCFAPLIPGTMTGPMFTNGAWQFMPGGAYIFTDPVGQSTPNADYWFGGTCIPSATPSYSYNGQTIAPVFQQGLNLGQPAVPLPQNDFSQKWAVLDGKGCGEGSSVCGSSSPTPPAVTAANLNAVLRDASGTPYPAAGAASGVYLPYCTGGSTCTTPNTISGGGIYVEGDAAIQLATGSDSSGNLSQIYTITQGSTVTTITTNSGAHTTTIQSGGNTVTLVGVPINTLTATPQPATMLYVNGNVTSLSGPGQGVAAIQDGSQLTIAAGGNVSITGDVIYKHEPVTLDTANTLVPGNDFNQALGIFTSTGNIDLRSPYANNNLQVDGSLAAIGQGCASSSCGFTVTGYINTFNNVGGQIQYNIFGANMSTQNTYFDRRFTSRPGFAPPWFPSTTVSQTDIVSALPPLFTSSFQRKTWLTSPQ